MNDFVLLQLLIPLNLLQERERAVSQAEHLAIFGFRVIFHVVPGFPSAFNMKGGAAPLV